MDSSNDILPFIGLMRKAGALELGADAVAESCALGRARILLMANDASGNTSKWMKTAAEQKEIPLIVLPTGKNELGGAVGVGGCAAVAVCDIGFAVSLCGKLGLPKLEEEMKLKLERQKRRKAKKLVSRDKHDTSKRGK